MRGPVQPAARRQGGAALVLGLFFLAAGGAALYFAHDTGAAVTAKTRLNDTADTAAYSAAVWRARALNYAAYANRAIIAQEVALAQAITRQSWAGYFERFTTQVDQIASVFPPARRFTGAVREAARLGEQATDLAARAEIRLRDAPAVGYKTLLQRSQQLLRDSAGGFGAGAIALEVAKAADPQVFAFAMPDQGAWRDFTRVYASDADRGRLRDLTLRSLDAYSRDRGREQILPIPAACLPVSASPADWFARYRKHGGTALVPGLERWEAADTGSVHNGVRARFSFTCRRREVLPMGWGAAEVAWPAPSGELLGDPGGVRVNPLAWRQAADALATDETRTHRGTGIARVLELNYASLANRRFPSSRIVVLASRPARSVRSAAALGLTGSGLVTRPLLPGNRLWAISAAEAYFRRPPGGSRANELASLYGAYWQARLAPVSDADRQAAGRYGAR